MTFTQVQVSVQFNSIFFNFLTPIRSQFNSNQHFMTPPFYICAQKVIERLSHLLRFWSQFNSIQYFMTLTFHICVYTKCLRYSLRSYWPRGRWFGTSLQDLSMAGWTIRAPCKVSVVFIVMMCFYISIYLYIQPGLQGLSMAG